MIFSRIWQSVEFWVAFNTGSQWSVSRGNSQIKRFELPVVELSGAYCTACNPCAIPNKQLSAVLHLMLSIVY